MSSPEDRERKRRFTRKRFAVLIHRDLKAALEKCAFIEGRSLTNLVQTTMWNYMAQTHGIKVEEGVTRYRRPIDKSQQVISQLDELLREDK